MFPKDIIKLVIPRQDEIPQIMLTKESNLSELFDFLLESLEEKVNSRLRFFMYEVEDRMDYLVEDDEDSPLYYEVMALNLGEETIEQEIQKAFSVIPQYSLDEELFDKIYAFAFSWVHERYSIAVAEGGLTTVNTQFNRDKLAAVIENYDFEEDVVVPLTFEMDVIKNLFEKTIAEMKELASTLTSYLEEHDYFKVVESYFKLDFDNNYKVNLVVTDVNDIAFFD